MTGASAAIYPAATMNNMAVLDETPQCPPLNALHKLWQFEPPYFVRK